MLDDPAHWSATADAHPFDISRGCASVTITVDAGERFAAAAHAGELYRLLLCADTVGGLERVLDRTVRYAGERHAFGRAIGAFQAVQHRLVDHAIRVRGMSLLVGEAAHALQAGEPAQSVALAELSVHASAPRILHDLLQLTGAIGFSWEYGLHFYERRAHQNARLAANPRAAARSLAHAEGWLDAH